jgi:hypothetical protein
MKEVEFLCDYQLEGKPGGPFLNELSIFKECFLCKISKWTIEKENWLL